MKILLYDNKEIDYPLFIEEIRDYLETFGYFDYEFYSIFGVDELGIKVAAIENAEEALNKFSLIFSFSNTFFEIDRKNPISSGIIKVENDGDDIIFNDFYLADALTFLGVYDVIEAMEKDLKKYESDDFEIHYKRVEDLRTAINILKKYINEPN